MNVPTVLEQPALPVELSATLELAADFARRRRHRRRRQPTGAIVGIGVQPPSGRHPGRRLMPSSTWARGGTRPTDHCSRLVANHQTHSSTFWK
jgi:hypothetical protein